MKFSIFMLALAAFNCAMCYVERLPLAFGVWLLNLAVWGFHLGMDVERRRRATR